MKPSHLATLAPNRWAEQNPVGRYVMRIRILVARSSLPNLTGKSVAESENEQREKGSGGMEGASAETQSPTAAFELLAKYEKTPTAKLFKDIAARAIENLNQGEDHLPR